VGSLVLLGATVRSFAYLSPGLPITTKWCFDQNVKVVPDATFTKRICAIGAVHFKKEGTLLQPLS